MEIESAKQLFSRILAYEDYEPDPDEKIDPTVCLF
jgi:hypothetical protein